MPSFFNQVKPRYQLATPIDASLHLKDDHYTPQEIQKFAAVFESHQRHLLAASRHDYAKACVRTQASICFLTHINTAELWSSLEAFQAHFTSIPVFAQVDFEQPGALEAPLLNEIRRLIQGKRLFDTQTTATSSLRVNLAAAIGYVYQQMNHHRQQHGLIYHQPRHPAEMLMDLDCLLQHDRSHPEVHLLVMLCALFHDVVFQRQRIHDEMASAEHLKAFLEPVFIHLPKKQEIIIKHLIDVFIVGGTTPAFFTFKSSENGAHRERFPTIESVFEIVHAQLATENHPCQASANYSMMAYFARILADLDIQRTSIPAITHINKAAYQQSDWQVLQFLYEDIADQGHKLSLQKKLTQGLRMIFEMILLPNSEGENLLKPLGQYVYLYQENPTTPTLHLNAQHIELFVKKITGDYPFSEINFARRMNNSSKLPQERAYEFHNSWADHIVILQKISAFLSDPAHSFAHKNRVLLSLARVASCQDGQHFCLEKLTAICHHLQSAPAACCTIM